MHGLRRRTRVWAYLFNIEMTALRLFSHRALIIRRMGRGGRKGCHALYVILSPLAWFVCKNLGRTDWAREREERRRRLRDSHFARHLSRVVAAFRRLGFCRFLRWRHASLCALAVTACNAWRGYLYRRHLGGACWWRRTACAGRLPLATNSPRRGGRRLCARHAAGVTSLGGLRKTLPAGVEGGTFTNCVTAAGVSALCSVVNVKTSGRNRATGRAGLHDAAGRAGGAGGETFFAVSCRKRPVR